MTPPDVKPRNPQYEQFFASFGKALAKLKLYTFEHPQVGESLQEAFAALESCLAERPEISIAWTGEKMLLNGLLSNSFGLLEGQLGTTFGRSHLHSITFQTGITLEEMKSFLKFLALKEGTIKSPEDLKAFFENEKVQKIQLNATYYTKVGGEENVSDDATGAGGGGGGGGAGGGSLAEGSGSGSGSGGSGTSEWVDQLENQPVESMLQQIITRFIPNPEDRKRVFEIILRQLKTELEEYVRKATESLESEKQQMTNVQQRTVSILKNIADGNVMLDDLGKIIMMDRAAEQIYGAPFSEVKGKKITEIGREDLLIALAHELKDTADKNFSNEVLVQSDEQTQNAIKHSTAMIQNPEGKIVGAMSLLNDIARHRELQRMQNDFMAHVTHELRSPLTAIKAALGTMDATPSQTQLLEIANRNIDRLGRLINDLLDSAKIGAGKMSVNLQPIDPIPVLRDSVTALQSWAKSKGITLTFEAPQPVSKILSDPDRLTQVVINLMSNSIKFTPKGGTIRVQVVPQGALFVKTSVIDSGPGMSKEAQAKLFERFFQLKQSEKSDFPGTGLGLYITKTFVELMKGQIGVESEVGKGSIFYFTLPVAEDAKSAVPTQGQTAAAPKKKGWLAKLFGG